VCLPTYNERENVELVVRAVGESIGPAGTVLVIDDNSPDGTGELAQHLARSLPYLEVLRRPRKEGLGPAYLAGFQYALASGADLVVEMDCDLSHDPADVARLLEAAESGDLILGSRYVAGGSTRGWTLRRRLVSRLGSFYAGLVLGLDVSDLTGGFKCFRREVLEAIDLESISSRGYAFQIETTYRANRAGFSVVEIPIKFADRVRGDSKMNGAIVLEALWRVPIMRLRRPTRERRR